MKPVKAWAITNKVLGDLALFDARLPLYWLRRIAVADRDWMEREGRIVRVEIREIPAKRKGGA